MSTDPHQLFMARALELASRGCGSVAPNPMVGCVIVKNNEIIGEGWHEKFGGPHAEVMAVNSVIDSSLLAGASVYVSLEPCSHFGKTPPCADLLASLPISEVHIASVDVNPKVRGNGIEILKKAGKKVVLGTLEDQSKLLNSAFNTYHQKHRPFLVLKWAETADGFVAKENFDSKWISDSFSRTLVHKWRSELSSILVGSSTAIHDNPTLTTRDWTGKNPLRILSDRFLSVPAQQHLLSDEHPTLIFNVKKSEVKGNKEFIKIDERNYLASMMNELWKREIQSLMIEGGSTLLQTFIKQDLWDECRIFISDKKFGAGISAPKKPSFSKMEETQYQDKLLILER